MIPKLPEKLQKRVFVSQDAWWWTNVGWPWCRETARVYEQCHGEPPEGVSLVWSDYPEYQVGGISIPPKKQP